MYSAYKLNKQGDNIQPWRTPFPIWNQSVVPCLVLTVASWPACRFLKRQVRWSGIPISFRIFQSIVIHTVKGFGIVNKAEIDVFLELKLFPSSGCWPEKVMAPHSSTLPGKSHWQRSLAGCSPWGHKELDMTEQLNWTEPNIGEEKRVTNNWTNSKVKSFSLVQSPSAAILEPQKIKSVIVSPYIWHEVMGPDAMILVFWMLSFKTTFSLSSSLSSRGSLVLLHFLP